jgi:putative phosphotransacetylase
VKLDFSGGNMLEEEGLALTDLVKDKNAPIGISNRHIHLAEDHIQVLFGEGHQLTPMKDLKQPGQYAAEETISIVGPKGHIDGVRILGPARKQSQIEVSMTDAFKLGVKPPVRDSGDLAETPGIDIIGPKGRVTIPDGVILAGRHIHMHTSDAEGLGLKDKDHVKVQIPGERGLVFEHVLIRVSPNYRLEMHVDTDEANACLLKNGQTVQIVL